MSAVVFRGSAVTDRRYNVIIVLGTGPVGAERDERVVKVHGMRHSDRRLTDKGYTDENLLGTWGAMDALPHYSERASPIASQILGVSCQNVASAVAVNDGGNAVKSTANIVESRFLTLPVTHWQQGENGGSGGARTRNLCRDRAAL